MNHNSTSADATHTYTHTQTHTRTHTSTQTQTHTHTRTDACPWHYSVPSFPLPVTGKLQLEHVPNFLQVCVCFCMRALQCVAVCCSVLQCVAVCCSVLQCVAVRCSELQCVAACIVLIRYENVPDSLQVCACVVVCVRCSV